MQNMSEKKKMITLKSCEGVLFEVEEKVALQSQCLKHMIELGCADDIIPLPSVTAPILAKVIAYCNRHFEASEDTGNRRDLIAFDAEFVKVDHGTLSDIILAANYLHIEGLLSLTCEAVAGMMRGKNPEEVRRIFRIRNDLTPEEEAAIRAENYWAF